MVRFGDIREGMTVHSADGRFVGRVVGIGDTSFELEQGRLPLPLPRHDYLVDYRDVAFVQGHDVHLADVDHPLLHLEVDDDGGALPPHRHANVDAEPVNAEPASDE